MKPVVDMKRCFASQSVCKAIKACPTDAISYIEVDEPILDKTLKCNCEKPMEENPKPEGGCDCADGNCGDDLYSCGGTPYGRIIIDYDKCIECGLCAKECCGTAIDMVDEQKKTVSGKAKCCCPGGKC
jgi:NAD-dependent dihydropyrimidine dehydrogenase PreA subunit